MRGRPPRSLLAWGPLLMLLGAGRAVALSDSRDPAEEAPVVRLGPPSAAPAGVRIAPAGVTVEVLPSRRSALMTARFAISAPPGALEVAVPSSLFQVELLQPGAAPLVVAVERLEPPAREPLPEGARARVDPGSGRLYARQAAGGEVVAAYLHRTRLLVPPSGQAVLLASAVLSSGFDRTRRRRKLVEVTHALHRRPDFFVYQFAAIGPGGPIALRTPGGTTAQARYAGGVVRVAAAQTRVFPLGATVGLGLQVGTAERAGGAVVTQGALRVGLDVLLPYGDALSLSGEAASQLTGLHRAGAQLVYQLHSPWLPFFPAGGHLDVGGAVDLWPDLRAGLRLGLGLHVTAVGLLGSIDIFPERRAPAPGEAGGDRFTALWRLSLLVSIGL